MRRWLLASVALACAACHQIDGPCCSNGDCPGNYVCSVAACASVSPVKGNCLAPCMVDKDCGVGAVCNLFALSCGCEVIADGGAVDAGTYGSCAGSVGD
jgi:hypothetical protein